jgi:hypothetical protein
VLLGALLGIGVTLASVLGLGVLAGAGTAANAATPANTSPPTITGTPQEGKKLTGNKGEWSGSPTSYKLAWTRCDKVGGSCANISGATTATYTLTSADIGNTLRFKVTATNADGSASASSVPTAVVVAAAAKPGPGNTSAPTIAGTPQVGQTLTGDKGKWSGGSLTYKYFWTRCDATGKGCSNISDATATTYALTSTDVGNTLRFKVEATNANGSTTATSAATAVVTAVAKPPATGCPAGSGTVQASQVTSPARLLIGGQQASPSIVHRGTRQLTLRYHVTACGGRPVQGALVYATAIPFQQLTIPPEQATGSDGWARLDFRMLGGFPVSSKQQLIAVFVRARVSGQDLLGGISTRRLFSVPVK